MQSGFTISSLVGYNPLRWISPSGMQAKPLLSRVCGFLKRVMLLHHGNLMHLKGEASMNRVDTPPGDNKSYSADEIQARPPGDNKATPPGDNKATPPGDNKATPPGDNKAFW